MDDNRDNESSEQEPLPQAMSINRRKFLGALGAATAAGAFLGHGGPAGGQSVPAYWFYDSHGNVVPVAADTIAAGVDPPPLPSGVTPGSPLPPVSCGSQTYITPGYVPPNILLIMVDQMRYPRWLTASQRSQFDSAIMPHVFGSTGALADTAFNFQNYFVAANNCTPSRATLLTGLYAQQTCIFATQDAGSFNKSPFLPPSLQPYNGGTGFPTIGDVLSQSLQINCNGTGGSNTYDTAWIGKWHVSDFEFGSGADPTGANGPNAYGFTSEFCIPTPSGGIPGSGYPNFYPTPAGTQNEGTAGDNLNGFAQNFAGVYNTLATPADPLDVNDGGLNIHQTAGFLQLSDAAIYHAFHSYWLNDAPPRPWFLALSFVNPHDIQSFPWAFGLASECQQPSLWLSAKRLRLYYARFHRWVLPASGTWLDRQLCHKQH